MPQLHAAQGTEAKSREGVSMKPTKKTAPKRQLRSGRVQGLRRELHAKLLYQILGKMQAQIRTGEEVSFRVLGICAHDHRGRVAGGPVRPAD